MAPSLNEWIRTFRDLHLKVKTAALSEEEGLTYQAAQLELTSVLVNVINASAFSGLSPRKSLRIGLETEVTLWYNKKALVGKTWDVGIGGFGAGFDSDFLIPSNKGEIVDFSLKLPGEIGPALGKGKIVSVIPKQSRTRVALAYDDVTTHTRKRISAAVWDQILATFFKDS